MNIIYKPRGAALEYAPYALNIYNGCEHRCSYCFGPSTIHKLRKSYEAGANPKGGILERLRKDAALFQRRGIDDEILLSFIGDPYQPAEMNLGLTRKAIEILIQHNLRFTVLTKGGMRATRDFDLLAGYQKFRFGTSLIFMDQTLAAQYEPGAATVLDRMAAIQSAYDRGIPTWVSVEPVIELHEAFRVIEALHPIVDSWKVGKINHNKALESGKDWKQFRTDVESLLQSLGANYYLKDSLTKL